MCSLLSVAQITLQQRRDGKMTVRYEDLERRPDVDTLDVPTGAVGYILGAKGESLVAQSHGSFAGSQTRCYSNCHHSWPPIELTIQ